MGERKICKRYHFSVEGETEKWYLEHLQSLINKTEKSQYAVQFIVKVKKDPREIVKALPFTNKTEISHLCDIESNSAEHINNFHAILDNMKAACKMGKTVKYNLGYSNFTFDLWIALHKCNCDAQLVDRKKYLNYINSGFGENFGSMGEYKKEENFKRCLKKITLDDVIAAIERAENIMKSNIKNGYKLIQHGNFTYYAENPSLSVHEIITNILEECSLLSSRKKALITV